MNGFISLTANFFCLWTVNSSVQILSHFRLKTKSQDQFSFLIVPFKGYY